MNVLLVGLSHKTAPVEIRERVAVPEERLAEMLERLKANSSIREALVLSTCNRVEVVAVAEETAAGLSALKRFFGEREPALEGALGGSLYLLSDAAAIRHLFRVAASLDSMMVGEPQILGQVKDAFDYALARKATGVILNKLFRKAISVARRVRSETKIAEAAVSISFAAVELAKKIFGELSGKNVLLIGAGDMAELAARHLTACGARVIVVNRSYARAEELAKEFGGIPAKIEELVGEMSRADIVLCSAGAPHYIIAPEDVRKARQTRRGPMFMIDISVPRNIDPAVNKMEAVFLYDIDDLHVAVQANMKNRAQEALRAEQIVAEEVEGALRWIRSLDAVPMIVAITQRAEEIRRLEVDRLTARIKGLSQVDREAIEALSRSLVKKLLHAPLVALKEEANSAEGVLTLEAARKLFNLDAEISSNGVHSNLDPITGESPAEAEKPGPDRSTA